VSEPGLDEVALEARGVEAQAQAADRASGSYDPTWFASLAAAEERHFWFLARNRSIAALTAQVTRDLAPGYRVLELGCGTGNVLRALEGACPNGFVVGLDLFLEGLVIAVHRTSSPLVQADALKVPFAASFDLVCLFDVLEHFREDAALLRAVRGMLRPKGVALVTVPAHRALWSYFDDVGGHVRRYEVPELARAFRDAGLEVEYITEYMCALRSLLWFRRVFVRRLTKRLRGQAKDDRAAAQRDLRVVPCLNSVLGLALTAEVRWLVRRRRLAPGASIIALARQPA
jgi:SAM-dependent methyltransferase